MAYVDENLNDPAQYFTSFLWTGDGNSPRSLTGVGFQANMMWSKLRSSGHEHSVVDTVRGVDNRRLKTDSTAGEDTTNTHGHFDSLDSDGFTVTGASGYWNVNTSGQTYVGWFWKESADAGFDIVSYTGNSSDGTTTQDISHSLSAVPHFIIIKNRADSTNWAVYHKSNTSAPETEIIYLNSTNATADDNAFFGDTDPTSSQFRVGGDNGVNGNSDAMIAYLWSEKQGYSKFGSFEGNANAAGPFVYCGFRPAWVMIKDIDNSGNSWLISDNKRNTFNVADDRLFADLNNVENQPSDSGGIDFVSNGFKVRTNDGSTNASGTRIFMAFAEAPFVNSNGVPCNAR